ncbi:phage tail family protein [Clostridium sporogenes]|uniref:phage tail family protein n=1 Tax=Clostridium sporogenes TaxID=1509 RepID=UPI0013C74F23|nr:phage tail family protein [Clostridium sporogenes]MCW6061440.1 phage tail family protein [Clostridium sporogenes]MCW6066834.1 phage tail family protein [Clostridium sporogenes]NFG01775.1 phage tail family protein [Clostridium sporogenes]NFQ01076.1 phage tail family protein [Clostridium sporogenes]NFQ42963.1 phage tail family protein [Clostridium sporogenes]
MDIKYLKLKLVSVNKTLELGNENYKISNIDGIEYPELELTINSNAHYDGSLITNKRVNKRYISIQSDYKGEGKEIERESLISFFNPKNKGKLIVDYCGLQRAIEYEVEKFNSKLINVYDDLSFIVDLTCPNPYWTDIELNKKQIALWKGDFHFPLVIPTNKGITMGHREPSLIVNVNNKGNVKTGMIIEFFARGTLSNPSLFNVNTREFIKINKGMVAGEKFIINTNVGKKKILQELNGATTDILNYLDIIGGGDTFLQLDVGDNLFRYNADSNLDNLEVNIYFSPQYLGV